MDRYEIEHGGGRKGGKSLEQFRAYAQRLAALDREIAVRNAEKMRIYREAKVLNFSRDELKAMSHELRDAT